MTRGANHTNLRAGNLGAILRLLRREEALSRTVLAKRLRLSMPALTVLSRVLVRAGWVRADSAGQARARVAGPRPVNLRIVPEALHAVSLYISPETFSLGLIDFAGTVRDEVVRPLPSAFDPEALFCETLDEFLRKHAPVRPRLCGIGVGVPGSVDTQRGIAVACSLVKSLQGVPLGQLLAARFRCTVLLENNVRLMALGESEWGIARGRPEVFLVALGTGIGGAAVMNGRLFRGRGIESMEIGHMTMEPDGALCVCGARGCLQTIASAPVLCRQAEETGNGEGLACQTPLELVRAARAGQPAATRALTRAARYLGIALANLTKLIDPEIIVLSGSLGSLVDAAFLDDVRQAMAERALWKHAALPELAVSQLADRAGLLGGAELVFQAVLADPVRCMPTTPVAGTPKKAEPNAQTAPVRRRAPRPAAPAGRRRSR